MSWKEQLANWRTYCGVSAEVAGRQTISLVWYSKVSRMTNVVDKARIVEEFDAKAGEYESNRLGGWYKAQSELIIEHIDEIPEGDILDIGCGTGWLLRALAQTQPTRRFVGIDISPQMIDVARSTLPSSAENVELIVADWESMDLGCLSAYRFAGVVCASTFHYFARPRKSLRRIHGSLAKGGCLYLIDRDKTDSPLTRMWDILHQYFIKDHVRFYSKDELQRMLSEAGFSNIERLEAIRRYFWHGKLQTNVLLMRGRKSQTTTGQGSLE